MADLSERESRASSGEDDDVTKNGYSSDSSSSSSSSSSSASTQHNLETNQPVEETEPDSIQKEHEITASYNNDDVVTNDAIAPPSSEESTTNVPVNDPPAARSSTSSTSSSSSSSSSDSDSDTEESHKKDKSPPGSPETSRNEPVVLITEKQESPPPSPTEKVTPRSTETPTSPSPTLTTPRLVSSLGKKESPRPTSEEEGKRIKKVQITDEATSGRPKAAHPKSARFNESKDNGYLEPVSSEIHIVRYRKPRSAPARSHGFHAQSSNLAFLQRECNKIEKQMAKTVQTQLVKRPKITPYKPFTWNSLAPYYNTDTLRYIIQMPVSVRGGYNTRPTASGMVDPEVSWKMDHCVTPMTPSRPELYRHHYPKRRTRSAMPRMTSENSILVPKFPRVTSAAYGSVRSEKSNKVAIKQQ